MLAVVGCHCHGGGCIVVVDGGGCIVIDAGGGGRVVVDGGGRCVVWWWKVMRMRMRLREIFQVLVCGMIISAY